MSIADLTNLYNNVVKHELPIDSLSTLFPTNKLNPEILTKIKNIYLNERTHFSSELQKSAGLSWVGRKFFSLSRKLYSFFCEATTVNMTLTLLKQVHDHYNSQEKIIRKDLLSTMGSNQESPWNEESPWMAKKEISNLIKEVQAKSRSNKDDLNGTIIKEDFLDQIKVKITKKLEEDKLPGQLFAKVFGLEIEEIRNANLLLWKKFDSIAAFLAKVHPALIEQYKNQTGQANNENLDKDSREYADSLIKVVISEIKPDDTLEEVQENLDSNIKPLKEEAFKVLKSRAPLKADGFLDETAEKEIRVRFQEIQRHEFDNHQVFHPNNLIGIDLVIVKINERMVGVVEQRKRDSYLRFCKELRGAITTAHEPFLRNLKENNYSLEAYRNTFNHLYNKMVGLDYEKNREEFSATVQALYDALPQHISHLNEAPVKQFDEAAKESLKKEAKAKIHENEFREKQKEGFKLLVSLLKKVLEIKINEKNAIVAEIDYKPLFDITQGKQGEQAQESRLADIKDYILDLIASRNKGDPKLNDMLNEANQLFLNLFKKIESYQLKSLPSDSQAQVKLPIRALLREALEIRTRVLEIIQSRGQKINVQKLPSLNQKDNLSLSHQSLLGNLEAIELRYTSQMSNFLSDHTAEDFLLDVNEGMLISAKKGMKYLGDLLDKFVRELKPKIVSSATEGLPSSQINLASPEYVPSIKEAPEEAAAVKKYTWEDLAHVQYAPSYLYDSTFIDVSRVNEFAGKIAPLHRDAAAANAKFIELLNNIFKIPYASRTAYSDGGLDFWRYVLPAMPQIVKIWQQPQVPSLLDLLIEMDTEAATVAYLGWLIAHQNKLQDVKEDDPIHLNTLLSKLGRKATKLVELQALFKDIHANCDSFIFNRAKSIAKGGALAGGVFLAAGLFFRINLEGTTANKLLQIANAAVEKYMKIKRRKEILKFFIFLLQGLTERHKIEELLSLIPCLEDFAKAVSESIEVKGDNYTLKSKENIIKSYPILVKRLSSTLSKFIADGSQNPIEKRIFEAIQTNILNFKLDLENKDFYSQICGKLTDTLDKGLGFDGEFAQGVLNKSRIYFTSYN